MAFADLFPFLLVRAEQEPPERPTVFIYVYLPEPLEPDERHARYAVPLDAELRLIDAGYVSGGGSLLGVEDEAGERRIIHSGVDVDAYDLDAARAILRDHLPELGCRAGTRLEWDADGAWEDLFTGTDWRQQPRTPYNEREGHD